MWALLLLFPPLLAQDVVVHRLQVPFEQIDSVIVNRSAEYIIEFVPNDEQRQYPARVWVRAHGADAAHPLLLTARQTSGAQTWQLPYTAEGASGNELLLYELERTLCYAQPGSTGNEDNDCAGPDTMAGQFSLHVSSACAVSTAVDVRAAPARLWRLPYQQPVELRSSQTASAVSFYEFEPSQDSVRLVFESDNDVCATLAVHNYTCPMPEAPDEMGMNGQRMTVQRSGAVHLSRSMYPYGFIVVCAVRGSQSACAPEEAEAADWLWESALGRLAGADAARASGRAKEFRITVQATLSRVQYAVAVSVTTALFLSFYVAVGGLALAKRWGPCGRLLAPRAVLAADAPATATVTADDTANTTRRGTVTTTVASSPVLRIDVESDMGETPGARRRNSTATYDTSDDDSSTDSEEEEVAGGRPPARRAVSPAAAVTSDDGGTTEDDLHQRRAGSAAGETHVANGAHEANSANSTNAVHEGNTTNEEQPTVAAAGANSTQTPFGLPLRLNVAALARRRARTLRARSDRYLHTLYTVAVFYALPVVQFVVAFQIVLNVSGSLDLCYYNFLCAHPAGALSDFNHVFSNLGYLLLGALFVLQVRRRRMFRRRHPKHDAYGIPPHYGLLTALGVAMMMVALLSASYHVCPNQLNFQFDTAFMYVLAVLSMVKIYQSRHPDVNARAHASFGVLAVLIALVVWGVIGGNAFFWGVFTVLHVFSVLLLSLRIYYVGQFRLDKQSLVETRRGLGHLRPLYSARLAMLIIANAVNWLFAFYGLFTMTPDFAGHMLSVLLCNTLLYMLFYLAMKLVHGERLRWYAWAHLAGGAAAWAPGLYFFTYGSSNWASTPAQSRHLNHECKVLEFYDAHDLWHILSAVALYLSFNAMLTWDDGLSAVPRTEIAVF